MKRSGKWNSTLRRRLIVQIGAMVVCSLMIAVGGLLGIHGLDQDFGVAVRGYRQLRQIYEVGFSVSTARTALTGDHSTPADVLKAFEAAQLELDPAFYAASGEPGAAWLDETKRDDCAGLIRQAIAISQSPDAGGDPARLAQMAIVERLLGKLAVLSTDVRTSITASQARAQGKRRLTLAAVLGLSAGVVVVAIVVGRRQYRATVDPLDRLRLGARRFAAGDFSERIDPGGDREFTLLAHDFNHMAEQLESLYRQLEEKVRVKSRELVRSERLASVGYLAAGVAHEINNPLGIITGWGERSLKLLGREIDQAPGERPILAATRDSIKIICEEAFRCKGITDRLLSLAKPGADDRRPVALDALVGESIANVGGLPEYASRNVSFRSDPGAWNPREAFVVLASEGELKQVILNLLLNALQAVEPEVGRVRVELARDEAEVVMTFIDNGHGMTASTVDRVFEPFFTERRVERRGTGERPGVGLGLSITHAIVAGHQGNITAESDGVGEGSRFTVRIPAVEGAARARR